MNVNNQHAFQTILLAVAVLTEARNPYGLAVGPDKQLYICEIDIGSISRVELKTKQKQTVLDGLRQPYELVFDKAGAMYFVDMPRHAIHRWDGKTLSAVADQASAGLKNPHSIALDPRGRIVVCDIGNNRIVRIDPETGKHEQWLGPLKGPRAIVFDKQGNGWLVLREGNAVYRIDAKTDALHHVAGTGEKGYTGDGGPAAKATLNGPKGIAISADGKKLYLADTENHAIRRIDLETGIITTIADTLKRPHGVFAAVDGTLYIGDSENHRVLALKD